MLRLSNAFYERTILSLRTGGKIGFAVQPLINPNNLKIEGWYAEDSVKKGEFILPILEVRDFITKGIVVNDHDAITDPEDLVRLKEVIGIRFELQGKQVVTESKHKLGKVVDFAVNDSFYVQKLYVNPPILKGLTGNQLLIGRNEIIEINDRQIVVNDPTESLKSGLAARATA